MSLLDASSAHARLPLDKLAPSIHLTRHTRSSHRRPDKMAPSLRKSLRQKTKASAKTAEKVGYTRRPRAPPSRKQRYTRNKGLVSMKPPKALQNM